MQYFNTNKERPRSDITFVFHLHHVTNGKATAHVPRSGYAFGKICPLVAVPKRKNNKSTHSKRTAFPTKGVSTC